jgi:uncharacterized RDD family membrane protein YckC
MDQNANEQNSNNDEAHNTPPGGQQLEFASRLARINALLIDELIILVASVAVIFIFNLAPKEFLLLAVELLSQPQENIDSTHNISQEEALRYQVYMVFLALGLFFVVNFNQMLYRGQTVGKRIMGIKVVTVDGGPAKLSNHQFKRYVFLRLIGLVPFIGLFLFYLSAGLVLSRYRRGLHDFFAGTIVIKS